MKRYLVLENGEVFAGLAFGAPCRTVGELVFTTGMNGYIETLTDPSYCGQIVLQTFPLIGNYGIIPADFEGKCCVRGYVVREQCTTPSNFRCEETLDAFLKENHIPGIAGIDTRAVTRILREAGTMNAAICDTVPDDLAPLRAYRITDPVPQVTTPEPYTLQPEGSVLHSVALIDYGAKRNIARELCKRGCAVTVLPCSAKAEDILSERHIRHRRLTRDEVDEYCHRFMAFRFRHGPFSMSNFKASDEYLKVGGRVVRSYPLVDIDEINLPSRIRPYTQASVNGYGIATDLFSFLTSVPHADCVVYNQVVQIPDSASCSASSRPRPSVTAPCPTRATG